MKSLESKIEAIDLFCGIGGLSYGLQKSGIKVVAGYDIDKTCEYAFEENNNAKFYDDDVKDLNAEDLLNKYSEKCRFKVLVGCAPCQPFSSHNHKLKTQHSKWGLLNSFADLVEKTKPDIVSMENVPNLQHQDIFKDFVQRLKNLGYIFDEEPKIVYCPDYGIPQNRKRLVLLASLHGEINLIPPTHTKDNYANVRDAIGSQEPMEAGSKSKKDPLHRVAGFTKINLERIQHSKPKGSWRDWPERLVLECHKKKSGQSYGSVYGRMSWDEPSPTITTQFFNYGTGRFGHPEQDRAISLREGAILQSFPSDYKLLKNDENFSFQSIARHIGNAVPPKLGEIIGLSILNHIQSLE